MSKSVQITVESISKALESSKPTSLTGLWKALGGTASVSGSAASKMRELVPGIEERLASNKAGEMNAEEKPRPTIPKSGKTGRGAKKNSKAMYARCAKNPFREGSNYALAFDVLASFPEGLPLPTWRELYAKAARKSLTLASYDIQVLLTAKDTPTGERHRSCRSGFYIEREADHVTLKIG